jgi:hypothetical protein
VNSGEPIRLAMQVNHAFGFSIFFILKIIFHLIDVYDNKVFVNLFHEICFLFKENNHEGRVGPRKQRQIIDDKR